MRSWHGNGYITSIMRIRTRPSVTSRHRYALSASKQDCCSVRSNSRGRKILAGNPLGFGATGNRGHSVAAKRNSILPCWPYNSLRLSGGSVPHHDSQDSQFVKRSCHSRPLPSKPPQFERCISRMPRKADPYLTWLHRWMDIILFAVVFAIVAILLTASADAATPEGLFQEARSIQPAITPFG